MVISVASTFEFDVVGWVDAPTVIALCDVDLFFAARSFDINLSISVLTVVVSISVATWQGMSASGTQKQDERQVNICDFTYVSLVISTSEWSLW